MSVFTIFNHGTDFHRDKQATEIVSVLSKAINGKEALIAKDETAELGYTLKHANPTHIICEGPGSEAITADEESHEIDHTWPGRDNPITRDTAKVSLMKQQDTLKKKSIFRGGGNTDFQKSFYGDTPQPWKISGQVSGSGWNDNVYKAVWMLTHLLFSEGMNIDTVNIIGWSRGAVTCLKQAHLLQEVLPQIKINILAFDPVPGKDPSSHEADTRTITDNIKTYWGVLALNERRMNFRCTDPAIIDNQATQAWIEYLPMPGNHSDVVRPNLDTQNSLRDANGPQVVIIDDKQETCHIPKGYKIALNLAHRFLSHFGTDLKPIDQPNNTDCLGIYDEMYTDLDAITREYAACESWTDISTPRLGWRYHDRDILSKFSAAQSVIPQDGDNRDAYYPYTLHGWINTHHWILAKNQADRAPCPTLDYPFLNVSQDRITKWEEFLGIV